MSDHAKGCEGRSYTCKCGYDEAKDAELSKLREENERLNHLLKQRDRMSKTSRDYWVRAAREAMNGDFRALRNRVDLSTAPPMQVVLSEDGGSDAN